MTDYDGYDYDDEDTTPARTWATGLIGWVDLPEAARELGCTEDHVMVLARAGAIQYSRWRGEVVVSQHSVSARLQRQAKVRARAAEKARKAAA